MHCWHVQWDRERLKGAAPAARVPPPFPACISQQQVRATTAAPHKWIAQLLACTHPMKSTAQPPSAAWMHAVWGWMWVYTKSAPFLQHHLKREGTRLES